MPQCTPTQYSNKNNKPLAWSFLHLYETQVFSINEIYFKILVVSPIYQFGLRYQSPLSHIDGEIRDGDYREEPDSVRCWSHTWQKKPPRISKTLTPRTPSLHKASPYHVTLRNQEGSCTARSWLQTCLRDIDQQVSK
jgi:hypothetical protein